MRQYINRFFIYIYAAFIFTIILPQDTFAGESIKSRYFNIDIADGIDKVSLLRKLHAEYFLRLDTVFFNTSINDSNASQLIGKTLDGIYAQASDILDIHMYDLTVGLKILPDTESISKELTPYFNKKINVPSFYYFDENTIYIAYSDVTLGMLSHEVAHAIVSHYFVVPPPARLQEILTGYVEYTMRKLAKDLPTK